MTDVATKPATDLAYTDMSLEELIDARADVVAYRESDPVKAALKQIADAAEAQIDLESMIALRMEEKKQRKFERGGYRGFFKMVKRGSAKVFDPERLRKKLLERSDLPKHALDKALPEITPPPIVKPDLRETRKLADYGIDIAAEVRNHIVEADEYEVLLIEAMEPPMLDVTGSAS